MNRDQRRTLREDDEEAVHLSGLPHRGPAADAGEAVNIMIAAGLAEIENACGGSVRPEHALAEPVKQEPTEQTPTLLGAV